MKPWIAAGLACGLFFTAAARADMIETKKEGILNGKILSADGQEVRFKDAKGRAHVFKKKDVLFMEKEDPSKAATQTANKTLETLKDLGKKIKKSWNALAQKISRASKPIDRSGANAKSAALYRTMDERS